MYNNMYFQTKFRVKRVIWLMPFFTVPLYLHTIMHDIKEVRSCVVMCECLYMCAHVCVCFDVFL